MSSTTYLYEIDAGEIHVILDPDPAGAKSPVYRVAPRDPDRPADRVTVELDGQVLVELDAGQAAQTYLYSAPQRVTDVTFVLHIHAGTAYRQFEIHAVNPTPKSPFSVEFRLLPLPPPKGPPHGPKPADDPKHPSQPTTQAIELT